MGSFELVDAFFWLVLVTRDGSTKPFKRPRFLFILELLGSQFTFGPMDQNLKINAELGYIQGGLRC